TSFTVTSPTQIAAVAPPYVEGTLDVTVTTNGGTSSITGGDQYTYWTPTPPSVTRLSPTSGSTAGGTTVTVIGAGFTWATSVRFAGLLATSLKVLSDTKITVVSPAHLQAGPADVIVYSQYGMSATSAAD